MLVGPRRTGKSSTGNTLLGRGQVFETRGGGTSTAANAVIAGRYVNVVDAQGWGCSEDFVPKEEKSELLRALSLFALGGPHVVLLVIPLLDFTESEWRALERRMEILTSTIWRHTMVLFTCGERLKRRGCSVEEHIQSGGPVLHLLMNKCRYRYHVFDNKATTNGKADGRKHEVHRGGERQVGTGKNKTARRAGWRRTRGERDVREEGEQKQVRELLLKVENMLEENGGWHYSLHMYQRMEEEWCRREQELKTRLEAEMDAGCEGRKQKVADTKTQPEPKEKSEKEEMESSLRKKQVNRDKRVSEKENLRDDIEGKAIELETLRSEEVSCGGEGRKTRNGIRALCQPDWGQGSAFSPVRGLA